MGLRGTRKMNGALEAVEPAVDRDLDAARAKRLIALAMGLAAAATAVAVLV